jgi:hypothetical protein
MDTQPPIEQLQHKPQIARWSLASRVSFRFCFAYFGLYCLVTQILTSLFPIPNVDIPDLSARWPLRQIIFWTAAHVFRVPTPLVYSDTGSGDKTFDWVLVFCLLVFATLSTALWSVFDSKREDYVTLYKWFRLFIRFSLAGQMLAYGMFKVIPMQMPFPFLARFVEPFGNFSPMGVLWYSIGASPAYETFTGCAEMLGGLLLLVPRTTLFGALICLADTVQVFMLNMTYDVPVKLLSFHLILMALFLLAPDLPRLANLFFLSRPAGPSTEPRLFGTRRANRIALAVQILFGIWLVALGAYGGWDAWHTFGGGRPKSPLYGIWNVEQLWIDGQLRSPLLTDYDRWRRVIFDTPDRNTFQRMDDSLVRCSTSFNLNDKTVALTKDDDKNWKANFTFKRVASDQLTLDGEMDSHKLHMQLQLVDLSKFLLINRRFHWVQEYPFNR